MKNKIKCKFIRDKSSKLPILDPNKIYICNRDKTLSCIIIWLRNQLYLTPEHSLFLSVNKFTNMSTTLGEIFDKYKSDDNYLYITYFEEHSYG